MMNASWWKRNGLFCLALAIELAIIGVMVVESRIPAGHDGFQYFTLQYYFLNGAVFHGELPLWLPYMTQGAPANWWYTIQGNLLINSLTPVAFLLESINFFYIYYAGLFVDQLVFVTGLWLLGRRLYERESTIFFVVLAAGASAIPATQPWFNFHFYSAFPLIIVLLHRFMEKGEWLSALGAGNLIALQTIGNLPYALPAFTFFIFLYFLFYYLARPLVFWKQLRRLRFGWLSIPAIVVVGCSLFVAFLILELGTESITYPGRSADRANTLDGFLTYAGNQNWPKWFQLVVRISPALDYNLYAGILLTPFLLFGVWRGIPRGGRYILFTGLAILLFGMGLVISTVSYHLWPFMPYFRHLSLTAPFAKLFLILVAAYGLETFFSSDSAGSGSRTVAVLLISAGFIVGGLLFLYQSPGTLNSVRDVLELIFVQGTVGADNKFTRLPAASYLWKVEILPVRLFMVDLFAILGLFVMVVLLAGRNYFGARTCLFVVLLFQGVDCIEYRIAEWRMKTARLDPEGLATLEFTPLPYRARRTLELDGDNPRVRIYGELQSFGTRYWSTPSFLFEDEAGSSYRADHWMRYLDLLLRTYWGQDIYATDQAPAGHVVFHRLEFPAAPVLRRVAGITLDKIQFFSRASQGTDEAISSLMRHPGFKGNVLLLSRENSQNLFSENFSAEDSAADDSRDNLSAGYSPRADHRIDVPYEVLEFSSNRLTLRVSNDRPSPIWLLYCDVWHPFWQARVDESEVDLRRGNLAYKAVRIEPGEHRVEFRYGDTRLELIILAIFFNSIIWLIGMFLITGFVFREQRRQPQETEQKP